MRRIHDYLCHDILSPSCYSSGITLLLLLMNKTKKMLLAGCVVLLLAGVGIFALGKAALDRVSDDDFLENTDIISSDFELVDIVTTTIMQDWYVSTFFVSGATKEIDNTAPDGSYQEVLYSDINNSGYILSFIVEELEGADSKEDCVRIYRERLAESPVDASDQAEYTVDGRPAFEYLVKEVAGTTLYQKHINTYDFADGYCHDFHFSKVLYTESDDEAITQMLEGIEIVHK